GCGGGGGGVGGGPTRGQGAPNRVDSPLSGGGGGGTGGGGGGLDAPSAC
ncbi:hypothetical protein Tco_0572168, partial [Tanacetum coccineum]